ncbi:MAG: hypothetical protein AAGA83_13525 [Cyanobacteria bacterium P01_F01_bin.116]
MIKRGQAECQDSGMQVWAIGIVCFYVALGLFNWVTGLHWLAEFSVPLSIVGGLGLAIASSSTAPMSPTNTDHPDEKTASTPTADVSGTSHPHSETRPTPEASISFTIDKNLRP